MSDVPAFSPWTYKVDQADTSWVLPDGCRDILVIKDSQSKTRVRLSQWDDRPRKVMINSGSSISGFRLQPGVSVSMDQLREINSTESEVKQLIAYQADVCQEISMLVDQLSVSCATVKGVAQQAGVSPRTLQRRFKALQFPKPEYWVLLARIRNVANSLATEESLVSIADRFGFSDQAHMTRECVRWFGMSPVRLRANELYMSDLEQPGLANWSNWRT